jgi:hypothetical protein
MINTQTISYPFGSDDLQAEVDYLTGNYPIYIGRARPGAATSAAEWQIKKFTYDGNNNVLRWKFADNVNDYNKVWDNRAGYSYV